MRLNTINNWRRTWLGASIALLLVLACGRLEPGSPTATMTNTVVAAPSTATASPTATRSPSPSPTATAAPMVTATPRATAAPTVSPTAVPTPAPTATSSPTPTATATPTPTPTLTPSPTPTPVQNILVLSNGLVLTGRGDIHHGWVVELTNGIITHLGSSAVYTPPPNAVVIDVTGKTIMPGVINAHVHGTASQEEDDFSGQAVRRTFLLDGVTTTCNVGHRLEEFASFEIDNTHGGLPAGRALSSGPQIVRKLPNPAPATLAALVHEVLTEDEIKTAVDLMAMNGADYIKIASGIEFDPYSPPFFVPPFSEAEIRYVVEQASASGLPVRALVTDGQRALRATNAGVSVFDGVPAFRSIDPYLNSLWYYPNVLFVQSQSMPELDTARQILDEAVFRGVVMVPMLTMMDETYPWERPTGGDETQSVYSEVVEYFHLRGGRVAVGSDYPYNSLPGMPMAELQALQGAGLTNREIITAATYNSAVACGVEDQIGSLEVGKAGDIIVVNGNPLDDINALTDVTHVLLDGRVIIP